jgi:long-chain acyl-CoA synthetase
MGFERIWHKSYHSDVPAELDLERITMPEVLARTAQRFPDTVALIYMGKKITYKGLDGLVNSFAKALGDLGVGRGDKVAMLLPNIPQVVIANYATFRIGAVASALFRAGTAAPTRR